MCFFFLNCCFRCSLRSKVNLLTFISIWFHIPVPLYLSYDQIPRLLFVFLWHYQMALAELHTSAAFLWWGLWPLKVPTSQALPGKGVLCRSVVKCEHICSVAISPQHPRLHLILCELLLCSSNSRRWVHRLVLLMEAEGCNSAGVIVTQTRSLRGGGVPCLLLLWKTWPCCALPRVYTQSVYQLSDRLAGASVSLRNPHNELLITPVLPFLFFGFDLRVYCAVPFT